MAGEPTIEVEGFLGGDAELRVTPNGVSVTSFTLANTPRTLDKKTNEWSDGNTLWFRCFVWGKNATGAANELRKGMKVIVIGRFNVNTYTDKENVEQKQLGINVDVYGIIPRNVAETYSATYVGPIEDPVDDPWF